MFACSYSVMAVTSRLRKNKQFHDDGYFIWWISALIFYKYKIQLHIGNPGYNRFYELEIV